MVFQEDAHISAPAGRKASTMEQNFHKAFLLSPPVDCPASPRCQMSDEVSFHAKSPYASPRSYGFSSPYASPRSYRTSSPRERGLSPRCPGFQAPMAETWDEAGYAYDDGSPYQGSPRTPGQSWGTAFNKVRMVNRLKTSQIDMPTMSAAEKAQSRWQQIRERPLSTPRSDGVHSPVRTPRPLSVVDRLSGGLYEVPQKNRMANLVVHVMKNKAKAKPKGSKAKPKPQPAKLAEAAACTAVSKIKSKNKFQNKFQQSSAKVRAELMFQHMGPGNVPPKVQQEAVVVSAKQAPQKPQKNNFKQMTKKAMAVSQFQHHPQQSVDEQQLLQTPELSRRETHLNRPQSAHSSPFLDHLQPVLLQGESDSEEDEEVVYTADNPRKSVMPLGLMWSHDEMSMPMGNHGPKKGQPITNKQLWHRVSRAHKMRIQCSLEEAKAARMGPRSTDQFLAFLCRRYGNLARAWRIAVDSDGSGVLTYEEFCIACRGLQYEGSIQKLWRDFDEDDSGVISFNEFAPQEAAEIQQFRSLLIAHYPTINRAWDAIATRGKKRVTGKDFTVFCRSIGWGGHPLRMLRLLEGNLDGTGHVTREDIDWLELPRAEPVRSIPARERKQERNNRKSPQSLEEFKNFLIQRYSNAVRAWRIALDTDGNGCLTYTEFCNAIRGLGYEGSVHALWRSLDEDDSGSISLMELEPTIATELQQFRSRLLNRFENATAAWQVLAPKGQTFLSSDDFVEACNSIGWPGGVAGARRMHRLLCCDKSDPHRTRYVSIADIEWLDFPVPEKYMAPGARFQWAQDYVDATSSAAHAVKAQKKSPKTKEEFLAFLRRRYGNIVRAWRIALDNDGNKMLTYSEFCRAVKGLGYEGSIRKLWFDFDLDNSGVITVAELSPVAAEELERFKSLLMNLFPTAEDAWDELAIDGEQRGQQRLMVDKFCIACEALGWQGNARGLHSLLNRDPNGSKHITLQDLKWLGLPGRETSCYHLLRRYEEDVLRYDVLHNI